MPLTIRVAAEQDQRTIRRIVREANINPSNLSWPHFMVAEVDRLIVGTSQVKPHRDGSRELASVAVVPRLQRQGIGTRLIEAQLARETGVLYLTCRHQLQGYYERFGFTLIARGEYPPYFARMVPVFNRIGRFFRIRIVVMRRVPPRISPHVQDLPSLAGSSPG